MRRANLRELAAAACALAVAATALSAAAVAGGRVYRKKEYRVAAFEVPRGWDSTPQIGYPSILVLATSPDGARLTLGVQRVIPGTTALGLAADARAALLRQGFGDARITPGSDERVRLDATFDRGGSALRQEYIVDGDLAFVVTLAVAVAKQAKAVKDYEEALGSLAISPPVGGTLDGGAR
ncbi:MAG: hypothetical protein EXR72_06855 [Myxococcales bacterium]|nr:hypothetical protein [Myxococcales bacterium]